MLRKTIMREALGELLRRQPEVEIVGLFPDLSTLLHDDPTGDVIVMCDWETAHRARADVEQLRTRLTRARILMVNVPDDDRAIVAAARLGVAGCVLEDVSLEALMDALYSVAEGVPPASPRVVSSLFAYLASHQPESHRMPGNRVTAREEKILELIAEGYTNKEIANSLFLQPQTVKNYARTVYEKLGVHSRLDLIRLLRSQEGSP